MMWMGPGGQVVRVAGASGTPTIPKGAALIHVTALATGNVTGFPDGAGGTLTVPVGALGWDYDPKHTNCVTTAANQLTFAGAYFVEYVITGATVQA